MLLPDESPPTAATVVTSGSLAPEPDPSEPEPEDSDAELGEPWLSLPDLH